MRPQHQRTLRDFDRTRPRGRTLIGHLQYRRAVAEARASRGVPHVALAKLNTGDVVDAFVDFHDGGYKRRPVIIVSATKHEVVALRCTTNLNRHPPCLRLVEWARAGLARPSTIDICRSVRIGRNDVIKRLGSLTELDLHRLDSRGAFDLKDRFASPTSDVPSARPTPFGGAHESSGRAVS